MNKAEIISRHAQALKNQVGTSLAIDECEYIMASMMNEAINYTHCCTQLLCVSDDFNFVTKGRVYNMEDEPDGHYVIIDDFGEKRLLWKHYFEIVQ